MKVLIVGNGVQGKKRAKILKNSLYLAIDKNDKTKKKINLQKFDTVFLCVPEKEKQKLILKYLGLNKNILVEKPLKLSNKKKYQKIIKLLKIKKKFLYIAYNHRFEPSLIKTKEILKYKKNIGNIYSIRIFYGNGTAKLVKKSEWRDKIINGIILDLGSHVFDILNFLIKGLKLKKNKIFLRKLENKNSDYAQIISNDKIYTNIEMSYCSWKNTFKLEIIGSKGSIYVDNLCKWGNSSIKYHKRVFPSGRPKITSFKYKKGDPTWAREHNFLRSKKDKFYTNIENEIKIYNLFRELKI